MDEEKLLRLAMVLQNQAPSTMEKYVCQLGASILVEYPNGIVLDELCEKMNEQFNLSFTIDEIRNSIQRKGSSSLIVEGDVVKLSEKAFNQVVQSKTLSEEFHEILKKYIESTDKAIDENKLYSFLLEYLYTCFNSNVDNLRALFDARGEFPQSAVFEGSDEEIDQINAFLSWDNKEKDHLIYRIVATCYEYCMLTMKKNSILSKELFRGKRFFLDANIIFRMAGINNEERQFVTKDFERHCNDAGIELICSSSTIDEIFRVINAEVQYINSIAGQDMPVSCSVLERLNSSIEVNDFYKRYYEWCQKKPNKCGDYLSFERYLIDLVQEVISKLSVKESGSYKVGNRSKEFEDNIKSLIEYKNSKRRWKLTSKGSAETDITNIFDVLNTRKGGTSIWQTNDFIVSADHRLIEWANTIYTGVPIVVLPSVWLSIILRFTGRSDDDYRSFCLFLTQRQHNKEETLIDTTLLLRVINTKTTKKDVKERIIIEIAQNKSIYSFASPEDYDDSSEKAFDTVLAEFDEEKKNELIALRSELNAKREKEAEKIRKEKEEEKQRVVESEREKTVMLLAKKRANDKVRKFAFFSRNSWVVYCAAGIIVVLGVLAWGYEWEPLYSFGVNIIPEKMREKAEVFFGVWTILCAGVGFIVLGIGKLFANLGSEERQRKLCDQYYKHDIQELREDSDSSMLSVAE